MPPPSGVLWRRDPHTAAKHDLLRHYLRAWYPITAQSWPRTSYIEGFAGPGAYLDDLPGSPIVALDVFLDSQRLIRGKRLDVVLLEEKKGRFQELQRRVTARVDSRGSPPELILTLRRGTCGRDLLPLLQSLGVLGYPAFVFLDSFGGPDVPHALVRAVAANRASEVLVTFGPSFVTRFGQNDEHAAAADALFGSSRWRAVHQLPPAEKSAFLLEEYLRSLERAGFEYTLVFEMVDKRGHSLFLVFGTSHERGVAAMKDAMWQVDPVNGVRYRDPRTPGQLLLDLHLAPDTGPLQETIVAWVAARGRATVADLRQLALHRTVYRPEHVTTLALPALLRTGRVTTSHGPRRGDSVVEIPRHRQDPLF